MTKFNIDRLQKLLCRAGHPGTPDSEALIAIRHAYRMLDGQQIGFDNLTVRESDLMALETSSQQFVRYLRRISALEKIVKEREAEKSELQRQLQNCEQKLKEQARQIREHKKTIRNLTKQVAKPTSGAGTAPEKKVARTAADVRARAAANAAVSSTSDLPGLIAAFKALRKIDPNMRIKAALAFLITAANDGLSVREVAERIGDTSEGSIRYTMRALGQGWPDNRTSHKLVMDCASSNGGRARLFVATDEGRAVYRRMLAAFCQEQPVSNLKLAA